MMFFPSPHTPPFLIHFGRDTSKTIVTQQTTYLTEIITAYMPNLTTSLTITTAHMHLQI